MARKAMVAALGAATLLCSWSFPLPPTHHPLLVQSSSYLSSSLFPSSSLTSPRSSAGVRLIPAPRSYLLASVNPSSLDPNSKSFLSLKSRVDGPLGSGEVHGQSLIRSREGFFRKTAGGRLSVGVRSGGPYVGEKTGEREILFDEEDLKRMKVADLKELCGKYSLLKAGKKQDLIDRLMEYQMELMDSDDSAALGMGNDDGDEAGAFYSSVSDGKREEQRAEEGEEETLAQQRSNIARATGMIVKTMGELAEGSERFTTQTRTGNCWHGLFFDIETKSKAVTISSINTASSPEHFGPIREDKMNVWLYTCEGSCKDKELTPDAWTMIGNERGVQLPTVSYGDLEATYGPLPMEKEIFIPPKSVRGFCVFCSSWRGVVLRANLGSPNGFERGEVTDEDQNIKLRAGYLPKNDASYEDTMFMQVYEPKMANAFVGAIEYKISDK